MHALFTLIPLYFPWLDDLLNAIFNLFKGV